MKCSGTYTFCPKSNYKILISARNFFGTFAVQISVMDDHVEIKESSLLTCLKCPACGTLHNASVINTVCINDACRSTLFAQYDLSNGFNKQILKGREATMWRYRELLPIIDEKNIVTLGEGFTPIIPIENLKKFTGD